MALPPGVWPTMITPFDDDKTTSIDYKCLDALIEWYIKAGVSGLFAVCQSSEMYNLSDDEKVQLARHVKCRAAGRVPVVACGTFGGSVEEQAKFVIKISKEVDAVVVVVNQLAKEDEGDEIWKANVEELLRLTEDIPLGLYECPVPYKRYLTPELLCWLASTGRFLFHKDTVSLAEPIIQKLAALNKANVKNFSFYNANVATLKLSLEHGARGFSGISANFYPWMHTWLCKNWKSEPEKAKSVQQFLAIAETTLMQNYPMSAKVYLHQLYGFPIKEVCRTGSYTFEDHKIQWLEHMKGLMESVCKDVGIDVIDP
ncbi:4-hydroxy-tetrahydrodipicolinate synthase-like isoform X2 [Oscarella lobularis]|uniref:4-hydroxy-tetrahydrodipicolinate synthase-like isoform X2 n=1 Tax=Oscarella lobularis TaxID=121494 RepID=UPI00331309E9